MARKKGQPADRAKLKDGRLRRPGARPPKAVLEKLLPLVVLQYAATGKGWYNRLVKEQLNGWHPRDPENPEKFLDATALIAWACEGAQEQLEAMAALSLREIGKIAYADIRQAFNADGSLKAPQDWPDDLAGAISAVETDERTMTGLDGGEKVAGVTRKVKFWDKKGANELILKAAGKLTERHELFGDVKITKIERVIVDPANRNG